MTDNQDVVLQVAAKVIITNDNGQVLVAREASTYDEGTISGRYCFPGGRLRPGEGFDDGLLREAKEETGLDVMPIHPFAVKEWRPTINGIPHHIIAIYVVCTPLSYNVKLSEEHDDFLWVTVDDLDRIDLVERDTEVIHHFFATK